MGARLIPLALAGLLAAALGAPRASAGMVSVSGPSVQYVAAAGEANALDVAVDGPDLTFTEAPGVTITAGAGCTVTLGIGRCPVGPTTLQVNLADGDDSLRIGQAVGLPLNYVSAYGGPGGDTLTNASSVSGQLSGEAGDDVLTGGPGTDNLSGGDDDDRLAGGPGRDQLADGTGSDQVDGGAGQDFLRPPSAPDGADRLRGGPDSDRIDFGDRSTPLTVTLNDLADDGGSCPGPACEQDDVGSDIESLAGGRAADRLTGSAGPDLLFGADGDDLLDGLGGDDSLSGDTGDDTLRGGPGSDWLDGGTGKDGLDGGAGDDEVRPGFGDGSSDTIGGGPGFDTTGTDLPEEPVKVSLNGIADDGFRNPELTAPPDNVKSDVESVLGSDGPDLLTGSGADNLLVGGGGADRLIGGGGADELLGGRGADRLDGGRGSDLLDGGSGTDRFKARDSRRDELRCGAGVDRGTADRKDRRGPDCDKVKSPRRKGRR